MHPVSQRCPKCGGLMEQGFIMDQTHGGRLVSQWGAGEPHKSFWMKTKNPPEGLIPIGAFRCKGCGFLECYARPEFAAK